MSAHHLHQRRAQFQECNRHTDMHLSEHHSFGENEQRTGEYSEDLAATMLATILGVEFDPDSSYDEKKEIWKISGKIYRTRSITQTAVGNKNGLWTTVIAASVLLP